VQLWARDDRLQLFSDAADLKHSTSANRSDGKQAHDRLLGSTLVDLSALLSEEVCYHFDLGTLYVVRLKCIECWLRVTGYLYARLTMQKRGPRRIKPEAIVQGIYAFAPPALGDGGSTTAGTAAHRSPGKVKLMIRAEVEWNCLPADRRSDLSMLNACVLF